MCTTCVLYKASKVGQVLVLQKVFKVGADMNMSHLKQGRAAVLAACKYGHSFEVIQELLNASAKADTRNSHGESALLPCLN